MDPLALWALIISCLSFLGTAGAVTISFMDWRQVGREEPWRLTKVQEGVWLLERLHHGSVFLRHVYAYPDAEVSFGNPVGSPYFPFRRGTKELIFIKDCAPGMFLEIYSSKPSKEERAAAHDGVITNHHHEHDYDEVSDKAAANNWQVWKAPLY